MKKKIIVILCSLFAFILLAFTCPNRNDHKEAIKYIVSCMVNEKLDEAGENDAFAFLGSLFMTKFLEEFLDARLKVNNYILFSVGEVNYKGDTKTVSFGILNHVFTLSKDDLKKNITEEQNKEEYK